VSGDCAAGEFKRENVMEAVKRLSKYAGKEKGTKGCPSNPCLTVGDAIEIANHIAELDQQLAAMQRIIDGYKADLKAQKPDIVVLALQLAYRKHHLLDDSVGSTELSDALLDAICALIGDTEFQSWLDGLEAAGLDNREIMAE